MLSPDKITPVFSHYPRKGICITPHLELSYLLREARFRFSVVSSPHESLSLKLTLKHPFGSASCSPCGSDHARRPRHAPYPVLQLRRVSPIARCLRRRPEPQRRRWRSARFLHALPQPPQIMYLQGNAAKSLNHHVRVYAYTPGIVDPRCQSDRRQLGWSEAQGTSQDCISPLK